jgi:hypothetical protein
MKEEKLTLPSNTRRFVNSTYNISKGKAIPVEVQIKYQGLQKV